MKNIINKISKWMKSESGMTLVELIVAMVIASIMIGSAAVFLPNYRDTQMLKQSNLDLNDSLRYAQTLALGKQTDDYVNWKIMDVDGEKQICVIDKNNLEEDPECESLGKIFNIGKKVDLESNFLDIYFQGNTGVMYNDPDFETAVVLSGEIRLIHINKDEAGDMYYGVILSSNSFSMNQDIIGEDGGVLEIPIISVCTDANASNTGEEEPCKYEQAEEMVICENGSVIYPGEGEECIYEQNEDDTESGNDLTVGCLDPDALHPPGYNSEDIDVHDPTMCEYDTGFEDGEECKNDNECSSGLCRYQEIPNSDIVEVICVSGLSSGSTCDPQLPELCESGLCERVPNTLLFIKYYQCS